MLEGFLARQTLPAEALEFEVVEMKEINISNKVPTSGHIATALNNNGWDIKQVSSIWTVSTNNNLRSIWNDEGIENLAGKGAVSRIWNKLKADQLTGFPKRPSCAMKSAVSKKQRLEVSSSYVCQPTTPSTLEGSAEGSPIVTHYSCLTISHYKGACKVEGSRWPMWQNYLVI